MLDYPPLPDPPRSLTSDELAALQQIRDQRLRWAAFIEHDRYAAYLQENAAGMADLLVARLIGHASAGAQPHRKDVAMTDEDAERELRQRLAGLNTACPICERHDWRVEVTDSPSEAATDEIRAAWLRVTPFLEREGEITRTCKHCGYRQHFAAVPMA